MKALEKEIKDLQGEFEGEREDYLETIRKQDRQLKLLQQISEKIAGTLKKECNYRLAIIWFKWMIVQLLMLFVEGIWIQ